MSVGALKRLAEGLPRPPALLKNVVQYSPTAGLTGFGLSDCQVVMSEVWLAPAHHRQIYSIFGRNISEDKRKHALHFESFYMYQC